MLTDSVCIREGNLPLVSVVMPSFNQAEFIAAAVDSVLSQGYPSIELIVVDGGSTDGTQAILAERAAADGRLRWRSQADDGPADALNWGFSQVRGTVIGWLNSDDLYAPAAIERAVAELLRDEKLLMVYGHGEHVGADGQPIGRYPTLWPAGEIDRFNEGCFICQPTVFFKRSLRVLLGGLDLGLKAAFDFDYWLRAFTAFPERIGFVDAVQAYSRLHDGCITMRMRRVVAVEGVKVLARHLGHAPIHWLLTYRDELLQLSPAVRGVSNIRKHLHETIQEVADCFLPFDRQQLQAMIDHDVRF
ncbi:MAG: glycosyltransferase family 2 protein [Rhodocyclaceae bacterium]|nr:glycosyltransferase family 2 protein [Rhodocyclaceae bacterium]